MMWIPYLMLLVPLLAGLSLLKPATPQRRVAAISRLATAITLGLAVTGLFQVLHVWPVRNTLIDLDSLSGVLTTLIALISLLVQHYGIRYLQAESGFQDFFRRASFLTAALLLFVMSINVMVMAFAWVMMSLCLYQLLQLRQGWQPAIAAAKRPFRIFLAGDVAFVLGAVCYTLANGSPVFASGVVAASTNLQNPLMLGAVLLLLLAALTKTAIIPFQNWLPLTMTAPTPVSAMMHAGFVNAGGIVLAKFAGLFAQSPDLMLVVFTLGILTALYGTIVMQVQTDIKRQLGYSTVGQMGFMMMQCGIGAFAAAMVHLVTHSLFKAALFLGSGSVVQHAPDLKAAGDASARPVAARVALLLCAVVLGLGFLLLDAAWAGQGALLVLGIPAALVVAQVCQFGLQQRMGHTALAGVIAAAMLAVIFIYGGVMAGGRMLLGDVLPTLVQPLTGWHICLSALLVVAAFLPLLQQAKLLPVPGRLVQKLYVHLLMQGKPVAIASFDAR